MYEFYEFIRKQTRDAESKEGGELEFPAGYMFKDVPEVGRRRDRRSRRSSCSPSSTATASRRRSSTSTTARPSARVRELPRPLLRRASASTPTRAWRRCARSTASPRSSTSSASARSPPGCTRRSRSTTRSSIPIYVKCVELDIPFCVDRGRARAARSRSRRRTSRYIDEVCWFFPELKFVDAPRLRAVGRPRGEAAAQVAEPLLLDHRVRAEVLPEGHHRLREHARRRQGHVRRATSPPASPTTASSRELPDVPFRDHVWPKFLRENAERVFKLPYRRDLRSRPSATRVRRGAGRWRRSTR